MIREKRKLVIGDKRISITTIRDFALIIQKEAEKIETNDFLMVFSVDATDDTSYESQSTEIFKENAIIEKKTLQKISMRLNTYNFSKNIEIQIVHSIKKNKENYIIVSGDDPNWVNGVLSRLSEIESLSEKQLKFSQELGYLAFGIFVLANVVYFRYTYEYMFSIAETNAWLYLILLLGVPIFFIYLADKLHKHLISIYPSVELQTGYAYHQLPSKKRKAWVWVATAIIIPILLTLILEFR